MTDQPQAPAKEDGQLHQRSRNYGKVPHAIMHDLKLTDGAVRLYAHMHWRYGSNHQNFEGRRSMAQMLGVSERTISNRTRELEAAGWIVVVERNFDEKSGAYRTPFYHVFETRKAARQFRAEYKPADGERVRPRPKLAEDELRKSRVGKGGKPSHKPQQQEEQTTPETIGTQVPTGTQVPQAVGTQVPPIHEQMYPRTKEDIAAPQADAGSLPKIVQFPTPDEPAKPARVKKQRDPDPLFDAVKEHVFGIEGEAEGGRIGIISSWLAQKNDGKRTKVGKISNPAEPQHVKMFAEWCERQGFTVPHDLTKFVENWRKWATAMNGSLKAKSPLAGLQIVTNDDGEAKSA